MEKEILRELLERKNKGLFSPADLFNGIGNDKKEKEIHELISEGYIEEVFEEKTFSEIGSRRMVKKFTFYRLSSKGRKFIAPIYKKIWYFIGEKTKWIIVISLTAVITAVITWLVTNYLNKK
jgi:hypothetical protein